ncbi:small glutamine-rich tetratricopeptide repeat-containing protein [Impatiens glandulifera]|uniref:small glutamine-rich tetratricopeptide repeat-containing protein n=1 Tax=Impatiens glandulifera TaxID=253017 RepID=UPI001FB0F1AA|nr:small glutamine-rich tetratricopeptide repeat-containing protein [Impatiens glandulifera]
MANLKTDSPLSRRIVRAFLDFLNSVEPSPGVDYESIEVAKECLSEVFNIHPDDHSQTKPDQLVSIFNSLETNEQQKQLSKESAERSSTDVSSTSTGQNVSDAKLYEGSQNLNQGEDSAKQSSVSGIFDDELFGQFFAALEKDRYFKPTSDGLDDQIQLDRATKSFHNALKEMQKNGVTTFDKKNLADAFKILGNKALQSHSHSDAVELYTFAICLIKDNAIYYCNRAAAYTQIQHYEEAIRDCLKSAEINPNYSKAYSRLGFAYYAQGKYKDAIEKGFVKALLLDPNNASVKENIRSAEQKLKEEQQRREHQQNSNSTESGQGGFSTNQTTPISFNINEMPADIANMLSGITSNFQGMSSSSGASTVPEININLNSGQQHMPNDIAGTLRSMMGMFSGGAAVPGGNPSDGSNERQPQS